MASWLCHGRGPETEGCLNRIRGAWFKESLMSPAVEALSG